MNQNKGLVSFTSYEMLNQVQHDKEGETGRTMLEMLGVLAIMGIITYGAIAGINYGMNSYKINQTYNNIQDIVQGIEDLYSWSKNYQTGMMNAACSNDIFPGGCLDKEGGKTAIHPFGDDLVVCPLANNTPTNGCQSAFNGPYFMIEFTVAGKDNCARLNSMDWNALNLNCITCNSDCNSSSNTFRLVVQ